MNEMNGDYGIFDFPEREECVCKDLHHYSFYRDYTDYIIHTLFCAELRIRTLSFLVCLGFQSIREKDGPPGESEHDDVLIPTE